MRRWWMLLACLMNVTAQAAGQTYAWLEESSQQKLVRITRGNQVHGYDLESGLQTCDEVSLVAGASGPIAIATADGSRVVLDDSRHSVKLRCGTRTGVSQDVVNFLQALLRKSNIRVPVVAGTRGAPTTCEPSDFNMPLLSRGTQTPTMLTTRARPLVLAWAGAAHPFSVQIISPAGTTLLQTASVNSNVYRTPLQSLPPGRYQLHLMDACKARLEEDYLSVVPAAERPPVPPQIAGLAEPGRTIYYAEYLEGLGDGRWGLEARQLVAGLPGPEAGAWIRKWTASAP